MVVSVTPGTTPSGLDPELRAALGRIARVPQLLIGCDYDGTLAPLVDDPAAAGPLPEAVAAVRALAALPQTVVAVISGRALRDLATLSRLPSEVHLVGSHGSEFDLGFIQRLPPELRELHSRLLAELQSISPEYHGIRLETKPASIAVHIRGVDPAVESPRSRPCATGPASWPGITYERQGRDRAVAPRHRQGRRGRRTAHPGLRQRCAVLGDDVTDENAFARLHGPDVGIKIGDGETLASYRVDEPIDAVRVLGLVLEMPAALALRRPCSADRAALDALERLHGGAARARRQGDLAVPSPARLGGDLRRHSRRLEGRVLLGHARAPGRSRSASATGRGR